MNPNVNKNVIYELAAKAALFDMSFDNQTNLCSFCQEYDGDWLRIFSDTARYINRTGHSSDDFEINCFTLTDVLWYGYRHDLAEILDDYSEDYKQKIIIGNKA